MDKFIHTQWKSYGICSLWIISDFLMRVEALDRFHLSSKRNDKLVTNIIQTISHMIKFNSGINVRCDCIILLYDKNTMYKYHSCLSTKC